MSGSFERRSNFVNRPTSPEIGGGAANYPNPSVVLWQFSPPVRNGLKLNNSEHPSMLGRDSARQNATHISTHHNKPSRNLNFISVCPRIRHVWSLDYFTCHYFSQFYIVAKLQHNINAFLITLTLRISQRTQITSGLFFRSCSHHLYQENTQCMGERAVFPVLSGTPEN